jgi:hypothetical protein
MGWSRCTSWPVTAFGVELREHASFGLCRVFFREQSPRDAEGRDALCDHQTPRKNVKRRI